MKLPTRLLTIFGALAGFMTGQGSPPEPAPPGRSRYRAPSRGFASPVVLVYRRQTPEQVSGWRRRAAEKRSRRALRNLRLQARGAFSSRTF